MSSFEDKFVSLSELDLIKIFWSDEALRSLLRLYAKADFPTLEFVEQVTQADVVLWLSRMEPGYLITKLLSDIGGYTPGERKKLKNYHRSTLMMPIDQMKEHIDDIRNDTFEPNAYNKRGYVLRGSIRTDGFRLQLLAFKLNELNAVKYRRLPPEKLPSRLTSTLGGTDYFLTEIRNVVSTKQDVADLWDCDPNQIKVLGLDLGQAFVIGASAILPSCEQSKVDQGQGSEGAVMKSSPSDVEGAGEVDVVRNLPTKFHNLAVKQKAVYQPTLKHRRWLERRKEMSIYDSQSIAGIETGLSHRRGPGASMKGYVDSLQDVGVHLDAFYGNVVLKKHKWNARKARDEEYKLIANRLLQLVGGSLGAKREASNKVVIGVGLGKFSSKARLSSLHESFQSYFVQKVSSRCW